MATKREVLEAANRGEGPLGRCADDEPVFVLVARDLTAAQAVRAWVRNAMTRGVRNVEKINEAERVAAEMDRWRANHGGGKVPD